MEKPNSITRRAALASTGAIAIALAIAPHSALALVDAAAAKKEGTGRLVHLHPNGAGIRHRKGVRSGHGHEGGAIPFRRIGGASTVPAGDWGGARGCRHAYDLGSAAFQSMARKGMFVPSSQPTSTSFPPKRARRMGRSLRSAST